MAKSSSLSFKLISSERLMVEAHNLQNEESEMFKHIV
jgi:hypothetical protein